MSRMYLFGFITGMSLATLLYLLNVIIEESPTTETTQQERFEVVDTYNGCDVVKWNGKGKYTEYKFFLDCRSIK